MARIDPSSNLITGPASNESLVQAIRSAPHKTDAKLSSWTMVGLSRELIFRVSSGCYEVDFIMFTLDAASGDITLGRTFSGEGLDEDDVKSTIAASLAQAVPVYPEDDAAAEHLVRLHASLLTDGFTTTELGGEPKRLRWTGKPAVAFDAETSE